MIRAITLSLAITVLAACASRDRGPDYWGGVAKEVGQTIGGRP